MTFSTILSPSPRSMSECFIYVLVNLSVVTDDLSGCYALLTNMRLLSSNLVLSLITEPCCFLGIARKIIVFFMFQFWEFLLWIIYLLCVRNNGKILNPFPSLPWTNFKLELCPQNVMPHNQWYPLQSIYLYKCKLPDCV